MLSDICLDFIADVYLKGTDEMMLEELREGVMHYSEQPFDYDPRVTRTLLKAVELQMLEDKYENCELEEPPVDPARCWSYLGESRRCPEIGSIELLQLICETGRHYWSADAEDLLLARYKKIWPHGTKEIVL
jgi:hypothetical protein